VSVAPEGEAAGGPLLALETSGPTGSVAVGKEGRVLARSVLLRSGEQSSAIVPAIATVLEEAGLRREELAGVVVGAGPGSFTGVRIAAATAKGIAHALGVPLWAFSSLAAAALSDHALPRGVGPEGWWADDDADLPLRWVLFDARGERVYAGCYRIAGGRAAGRTVEEVVPGHPTTITRLLEGGPDPAAAFAGDGAVRHRDRLAASGHAVLGPPAGTPTADALLHLLAADPGCAPLAEPGRWEPEYLRASSAERAGL
jgi:tRNA threonylcarbamoyladenosine biosynthesis protein TsaB